MQIQYQGRIVKGIAGFYYVYVENTGTYECKAKGIFRKDNMKPLVGDNVLIESLNEEEKLGNVIDILPRRSELIRPAVANIDQALIIFALKKPEPNYNLLDRFLIMMQQQGLPCIVCFNKSDIVTQEEIDRITSIYGFLENRLFFTSAKNHINVNRLKEVLKGKITAVAGPSGVGKSTMINELCNQTLMETGDISKRVDRGKHTTRHTQLFCLDGETSSFILDTPGFSSLGMFEIRREELGSFYQEFTTFTDQCKYIGCAHIHEPVCGVKEALNQQLISPQRYANYCKLYEELKNKEDRFPR